MADLEREITHGYEASRLLSAITPYFNELRAEAYATFLDSSLKDSEHLLLIKMQARAITALEDKLNSAVSSGAIAAEQVRRENNG